MYLNQSSDNYIVAQQSTQLNEVEMQLLTKRIVMNLTKSALQAPLRKTLLPASTVSAKKINDSQQQNYATGSASKQQQKLLRFPAMPLEETIAKFLKSIEPLLDLKELTATMEEAEKFVKGDGAKLQKLLQEVAEKEENWLAHRWLRAAYLQYRDPVPCFSSPGLTFPIQRFRNDGAMLSYTAKIVYGLIKFKKTVDDGKIPVVKMGKFELDNSQFGRVFGTCRIPKPVEDGIEYHPDSKHVVIIYKNHFFKLPVYDKSGKQLHYETLYYQLKDILKNNPIQKGKPFGILSSNHRDKWAESYEELIKIPGNKESVQEIQKCLFTVSIDQDVVIADDRNTFNIAGSQLMIGGGSQENSGNRWFDKTIQFIVNPNGTSGFCYEHSPAEGQPVAMMMDYVVDKLKNEEFFKEGSKSDFECAKKLELKTSECLDELINEAKSHINGMVYKLRLNIVHFEGYGKEFLKQQKLSPDSFIQIALQFAFYKLHKTAGAGYESAHLRIYKDGRTETIRSCSTEAIEFSKAMLDPKVSDDERVNLMRKAINGHRAYTNMALQGKGVDRHLLGLKLMAIENNLPIPAFYKTPGYIKSAHFRLSTSQVATNHLAFMCYGPIVFDGYACCYNPRKYDMILALSAWRINPEVCVDKFAKSLEYALIKMMKTLCRAGEQQSAKL